MTLTRRELFEFGTFLWSLLKKCVVRTEKTMKNDKSHTLVKRVVFYRLKCCVLIKYAILIKCAFYS